VQTSTIYYYAKCHYAECRYAGCRGALKLVKLLQKVFIDLASLFCGCPLEINKDCVF
jgi:hypothetical protein